MNSPFYEAEQKRLYPHRAMTFTVKEIADHMRYLIANNYDTLHNMRKTTLRELQYKYFVNGNTFDILHAFDLLKKEQG